MQRFILGSLRAPAKALEDEIAAVERRLIVDPGDTLCVGSIVLIPTDLSLNPERIRDAYADVLKPDLFVDYAVGTICGPAYAASDTDRIERRGRRTLTYGTGGRVVVEIGREGYENWLEIGWTGGEEVPETIEINARSGIEETSERVTLNVMTRERIEDAEFLTEGLLEWTVKTLASGPVVMVPGDTKLVVLVTRDEFSNIEGPRLDRALGPTASVFMKSERAAAIAVMCEGRPETIYRRIKHCIPPHLVEDFIILNIDDEVAGMRPEMCPLASWMDRSRGVAAPENFFKPRRRPSHR